MNPLQLVLKHLDNVSRTGDGYRARCPAHDDSSPSLSIGVGRDGKVLLCCFAGCDFAAIVKAMGLKPEDLFVREEETPFSLGALAVRKQLPSDWLRETFNLADTTVRRKDGEQTAIAIPYNDLAGKPMFVRHRLALRAKDGTRQPPKTPVQVYGLWLLQNFDPSKPLLLVEGESDVWSLTFHGIQAIGVPGADVVEKCLPAHVSRLAAFEHLYVWQEKGKSGQTFVPGVRSLLPQARILWGDGIDDPAELHCAVQADRERFRERLGAIIAAAGDTLHEEALPSPPLVPGGPAPSGTPVQPQVVEDIYQTDLGNARTLVAWHGRDLRFVTTWEKWLVWDGNRWKIDVTCKVERLAKATVCRMIDETQEAMEQVKKDTALSDDQKKEQLAKLGKRKAWAIKSQNKGRLTAMVFVARSEAEVAIPHTALDTHPFLLPCRNGTLDLRSGELCPSRREDLLTKLCPHEFDPAATCPAWEAALLKIFAGNKVMDEFLRRLTGYALTGSVEEDLLPMFHGGGSNGKTLVMETLREVIGPDYAGVGPDDLMLSDRERGHPTALADLFGKRLVTLAETAESRKLNETLVKKLTSRDRVKARRMREDFWEFDATHKIFLATNHLPRIAGTDHGIWRRVCVVPFNVKFWNPAKQETGPPELEADKTLPGKLAAEMPGILAWAVRGCLEWRRDGLGVPDQVTTATKAYREKQDVIAAFIAERCRLGQELKGQGSELYDAYKTWHEKEGRDGKPMSGNAFGEELKKRFPDGKVHGVVIYKGIALASSPGQADDETPLGEAGRRGRPDAYFPHAHTREEEDVAPNTADGQNASPASPPPPTQDDLSFPFGANEHFVDRL